MKRVPVLVRSDFEHDQPAIARSVQSILDTLPEQTTLGLQSVVLRSGKKLSRREAKEKALSRSGLVRKTRLQAVYYGGPKERDVRIELFVDKLLGSTPPWFLRIPPLRDLVICQVLCHELGHHIQATRRLPGDPEAVAEAWSRKLSRIYFQERYGHLSLLFKIILAPLRALLAVLRIFRIGKQ